MVKISVQIFALLSCAFALWRWVMRSVRVSTCIVGGGPAGLMLGLLLAKRGADVLVLEAHENFEREFRGEVLQPSTAHLLDELGLLEYVQAQPHSLLEAGKVRLTGKKSASSCSSRSSPQSLRHLDAATDVPRRDPRKAEPFRPLSAGWAPRCRAASRKTAGWSA